MKTYSGKPLVALSLACLFAALMAAGAWLKIPVGIVPVTLTTFFVLLAAFCLEPLHALLSVVLYVGIGMLGLPVFSGPSGGFAVLLGPTGGYIAGYLPAVFLGALLSSSYKGLSRPRVLFPRYLLAAFAVTLVIYAFGVARLKFYIHKSWADALLKGCVPFLAGDGLKILVALPVALRLRPWIDARVGRD